MIPKSEEIFTIVPPLSFWLSHSQNVRIENKSPTAISACQSDKGFLTWKNWIRVYLDYWRKFSQTINLTIFSKKPV